MIHKDTFLTGQGSIFSHNNNLKHNLESSNTSLASSNPSILIKPPHHFSNITFA